MKEELNFTWAEAETARRLSSGQKQLQFPSAQKLREKMGDDNEATDAKIEAYKQAMEAYHSESPMTAQDRGNFATAASLLQQGGFQEHADVFAMLSDTREHLTSKDRHIAGF